MRAPIDYDAPLPTPNQNSNLNYQQPNYQQTNYQQPNYQQPYYQQPIYQQNMYQQPMYQQPYYQQPMYGGTTIINGGYNTYPNSCGHPVPRVSVGAAIACLIINIFFPGFGTMISGCVPNENKIDFIGNCCCFFWLGVLHISTVIIFVGWILAIVFGVQLITVANLTPDQFNSYNIIGITNYNQIPVNNTGVNQIRTIPNVARM